MAKLLLISPKGDYFPFSFAFVMQTLKDNAIPYEFVDLNICPDLESALRKGNYFAAASGGMFTSFFPVRDIFARVKSIAPDIPTIMGGRVTSVISHHLMEDHSLADYLVYGEAEITLPLLLRHIIQGEGEAEPPLHIEAIAYRCEGKLQRTSDPKWLNLTTQPIKACWEDINVPYYLENSPSVPNVKMMPVVTGLGCIGRCTFCAPATGPFRARPVADVIQELEELKANYDFDAFSFLTEIFYPTLNQVRDFCEAYIRARINKPWKALLRSDMNPDALPLMVEAGCQFVTMGLETANDELLKLMNKRTNVENARNLIKKSKEVGLNMHTSIMFGNVGESEETIRRTVDFVAEAGIDFDAAFVNVYPGTKLYQDAVEEGLVKDELQYLENLEFLFPGAHIYKNSDYLNVSGMPLDRLFAATAQELPRAMASKYLAQRAESLDLANFQAQCRLCGRTLNMPFQPWAPFEMTAECPHCWANNNFFVPDEQFFADHFQKLRNTLQKQTSVAVFGVDYNACFIQNYGEIIGLPQKHITGYLSFSNESKFFFDKPLLSLDREDSFDFDHVLVADSTCPQVIIKELQKLGMKREQCSVLLPEISWPRFVKRFISERPDFYDPKRPIFFPHTPAEIAHIARRFADFLLSSERPPKGLAVGFCGGFAKQLAEHLAAGGIPVAGFITFETASNDDEQSFPCFTLGSSIPEDIDYVITATPSYNAQTDLRNGILKTYPHLEDKRVVRFTDCFLECVW